MFLGVGAIIKKTERGKLSASLSPRSLDSDDRRCVHRDDRGETETDRIPIPYGKSGLFKNRAKVRWDRVSSSAGAGSFKRRGPRWRGKNDVPPARAGEAAAGSGGSGMAWLASPRARQVLRLRARLLLLLLSCSVHLLSLSSTTQHT